MEVVLQLPAKYRLVIHLFYYEGYSTNEIATLTKQKESTVRQQLTRARRMLKIALTEEDSQNSQDEKEEDSNENNEKLQFIHG
jgi:RNA polymerase sigma-70 factor (ECF subfamily)